MLPKLHNRNSGGFYTRILRNALKLNFVYLFIKFSFQLCVLSGLSDLVLLRMDPLLWVRPKWPLHSLGRIVKQINE